MTQPVPEPDRKEQEVASASQPHDMGLRSHLRDLRGSVKSMQTVLVVLLVLIIIGGGCALLLR